VAAATTAAAAATTTTTTTTHIYHTVACVYNTEHRALFSLHGNA